MDETEISASQVRNELSSPCLGGFLTSSNTTELPLNQPQVLQQSETKQSMDSLIYRRQRSRQKEWNQSPIPTVSCSDTSKSFNYSRSNNKIRDLIRFAKDK